MRARLGAVAVLGLVLLTAACAGGETGPAAGPTTPGSPGGTPSPTSSAPTAPTAPPATSAAPSAGATTPPATGPASTPTGAGHLTIVVDDGTGTTTTWTLTCDPVGGTHPDPEDACAALAAHRGALAPVPKDRMCAQVYSGPERATITGTWGAEQVFASLSRINSCETARWDSLVPLVPAGGR